MSTTARCPHCNGVLTITAAVHPAPTTVRRLAPPGTPTIFGWPLDGSAGPPTDAQRALARDLLRRQHNGETFHTAAEAIALDTLAHYPTERHTP